MIRQSLSKTRNELDCCKIELIRKEKMLAAAILVLKPWDYYGESNGGTDAER